MVEVRCCKNTRKLHLYITKENRTTLLGREWIFQLRTNRVIGQLVNNFEDIHVIETASQAELQTLLQKYQSIMSPATSKIRNVQAKLTLKENARPIFCKARQIPFRLRSLVEDELQRLESEGILAKTDTAE